MVTEVSNRYEVMFGLGRDGLGLQLVGDQEAL
jgi:hypothetical protein